MIGTIEQFIRNMRTRRRQDDASDGEENEEIRREEVSARTTTARRSTATSKSTTSQSKNQDDPPAPRDRTTRRKNHEDEGVNMAPPSKDTIAEAENKKKSPRQELALSPVRRTRSHDDEADTAPIAEVASPSRHNTRNRDASIAEADLQKGRPRTRQHEVVHQELPLRPIRIRPSRSRKAMAEANAAEDKPRLEEVSMTKESIRTKSQDDDSEEENQSTHADPTIAPIHPKSQDVAEEEDKNAPTGKPDADKPVGEEVSATKSLIQTRSQDDDETQDQNSITEEQAIALRKPTRRAVLDNQPKPTFNFAHCLLLEPTLARQARKRREREREKQKARSKRREIERPKQVKIKEERPVQYARKSLLQDFGIKPRPLITGLKKMAPILPKSFSKVMAATPVARVAKAPKRKMSAMTPDAASSRKPGIFRKSQDEEDEEASVPEDAKELLAQADMARRKKKKKKLTHISSSGSAPADEKPEAKQTSPSPKKVMKASFVTPPSAHPLPKQDSDDDDEIEVVGVRPSPSTARSLALTASLPGGVGLPSLPSLPACNSRYSEVARMVNMAERARYPSLPFENNLYSETDRMVGIATPARKARRNNALIENNVYSEADRMMGIAASARQVMRRNDVLIRTRQRALDFLISSKDISAIYAGIAVMNDLYHLEEPPSIVTSLLLHNQAMGIMKLNRVLREQFMKPRCAGGMGFSDETDAKRLASRLIDHITPTLLGDMSISSQQVMSIGLAWHEALLVLPILRKVAEGVKEAFLILCKQLLAVGSGGQSSLVAT